MATFEDFGPLVIPPWVVFHVPHDSIEIPNWVVDQYVVSDDELAKELIKMTDHFTLELFVPKGYEEQVVRANVSRLVVDVERFEDDSQEAMAQIGMGCVYKSTSDMKKLRGEISEGVRQRLLEEYYLPHHQRLETAVDKCLQVHGRCLVVDCHSFPSTALPYERVGVDAYRPDICIGSDEFHSPKHLIEACVLEFQQAGWSVHVNDPFAGALVPASRYKLDNRVSSIMVEVNRALYMDEKKGVKLECFSKVQARLVRAYIDAIHQGWSCA